jgi:amino acid adenylation domain-containing protein
MTNSIENSSTKDQWLKERLKGLSKNLSADRIVRQPRPANLPLSFAQQRLWFLDQWEPESAAYLLPYAWRLIGSLDIEALTASLEQLMARHETLRTSFSVVEGQPVQVIAPAGPVAVPLVDLSALAGSAQAAECHRRIQAEAEQPFDLRAGSLLRTQLLRLGPEEHVLLLTLHHIITDGWSMGLFWQELSAGYAAAVTGQARVLPPLPIQYADFAVWQRQWLQGEVLQQQVRYWQEQLADLTPLALPTDAPRPARQTYRGASLTFSLPPAVVQGLTALSHQEGVTLFMTLLAAFQVVLAKYTGQEDIAVGSPIANRMQTELEGLIGFFVNTLVLRTRLTGPLSFRHLLLRVRETCLDAYSHQDVPFEKLVEVLQPVRDPSRHPLIQTMFQVHHVDAPASLTLLDLEVTSLRSTRQTAKFDLQVGLVRRGERMTGNVLFNPDLFEAATMERFSQHFQRILEEVVRDPDQRLSEISVLDEAERQQQLVEWNDTTTAYPQEASLPTLFAVQVAERPETISVVCGEEQLTYGQLDRRSTQLAHYMRRQGVGPETRVGVCLERGVDLLASLLAILKVGGAYMPLDPNAPAAWLASLMDDAAVGLVLTHERHRAVLAFTTGPVVILDEVGAALAHEPSTPVGVPVSSASLAYIMYTSGSTGQPKGTLISQRSVVRLVKTTNYAQLDARQRFLQVAPMAFDASTFEVWGSLLNGATLVVFPPGPPSLEDIGLVLEAEQISTVWLTAGLFHQMVEQQGARLGQVEQVLAGGDVLVPGLVRQLLEQIGRGRVINGYGPTENTTFTCCHVLTTASEIEGTIPIGRPISNTLGYVVDQARQLVPVGVPGELLIGGEGLAWGYLNQPALTAEKFIPHPFSQAPGARVYKTGDQVRWRDTGVLEFLGRQDNQIKLRGYRIELGEIEAVLSQYPQVHEAVVLCREDVPSGKQVVAYVTTGQEPIEVPALRGYLQGRLPGYMVPAAFVVLEKFPLTPNGKVDTRALLALEKKRKRLPASEVNTPLTTLELQLVAIWEQTLGISGIGVYDNFFELGGHSLIAANIFSQIEKIFQRKAPISVLFQAPTIHELASFLSDQGWDPQWSSLVTIQPYGSLPPFFAVPGVGGNVLGYSALSHLLGPDQPFYAFQSQGLDGKTKPFTSIEEMATHYIREMQTVQPKGPYFIGGGCIGGVIAYEMGQQLYKAGEKVQALILMETWPPQGINNSKFVFSSKFGGSLLKHLFPLYHWVSRTKHHFKTQNSLKDFLRFLFTKIGDVFEILIKKDRYQHERAILYRDQVSLANKLALSRYIPREYPGGIVHFLAKDRPRHVNHDRRNLWVNLAKGQCTNLTVDGINSGQMFQPPNVNQLASKLKEVLKEYSSLP